mmetsp:Transcript_58724/g.131142  ORF Transcript_58724/g.131142 Transcript_58724/m.131142 type:complete len:150 (-) Transcript_58724:34-483(-)
MKALDGPFVLWLLFAGQESMARTDAEMKALGGCFALWALRVGQESRVRLLPDVSGNRTMQGMRGSIRLSPRVRSNERCLALSSARAEPASLLSSSSISAAGDTTVIGLPSGLDKESFLARSSPTMLPQYRTSRRSSPAIMHQNQDQLVL